MSRWKTVKSLKTKNKQLKSESEYLGRKWGIEVLTNHQDKLKRDLLKKTTLLAVITIALIVSPIIPITSFCSTTGLCPYYNIWHPILTKIDGIVSERVGWNNTMIDIDNRWLIIIGLLMAGLILIIRYSIYKKDKEIKELY